MGAASPNWSRLAEMGKLPKSQEHNLPQFAPLNAVTAELNRLREGMCKTCHRKLYPLKGEAGKTTQFRCDVEGCSVMVGGASEEEATERLALHKEESHGEITLHKK